LSDSQPAPSRPSAIRPSSSSILSEEWAKQGWEQYTDTHGAVYLRHEAADPPVLPKWLEFLAARSLHLIGRR
jgi:hypothetical protein